MIDIMTPTEHYPFGKTSSSQGTDKVVIQQPLAVESYSWSDVPILFHEDVATIQQDTTQSCIRNVPSPPLFQTNHEVCKPPMTETSSSSSSCCSNTTTNNNDEIPKSSFKKSVRFAPFPEVRIYSLVLGDHPYCDDGLAIELGWEYRDDESHKKLNSNSTRASHQNRWKSTGIKCSKRSYLSRKQLLLDVAGCSEEELEQRRTAIDAKPSLGKRARIAEEDYYYDLAFVKSWF